MRVRLSPESKAYLKAIARWIHGDNSERARTFSAELRNACSSLASFPDRFPIALTLDGQAVRKRAHGDYLILYRVSRTEIEVIRIVHGARDWTALLERLGPNRSPDQPNDR
ncbi:MAG: type II toxin-antitoxin system RelE/ParE family toxin [Allosphingosinicella sp.]